jgi:anti-sigma factor RsiW
MIERSVDGKDGIIFVRGSGLWSHAEVDAHYDELRALIAGLRAQGRPVRVLVDVTDAAQQSDTRENYVRAQIERTYRPGDRVAMLVAGGEVKQHVRSVLNGTLVAIFISQIAAEMWLMEEGLPPPGCAQGAL